MWVAETLVVVHVVFATAMHVHGSDGMALIQAFSAGLWFHESVMRWKLRKAPGTR